MGPGAAGDPDLAATARSTRSSRPSFIGGAVAGWEPCDLRAVLRALGLPHEGDAGDLRGALVAAADAERAVDVSEAVGLVTELRESRRGRKRRREEEEAAATGGEAAAAAPDDEAAGAAAGEAPDAAPAQ